MGYILSSCVPFLSFSADLNTPTPTTAATGSMVVAPNTAGVSGAGGAGLSATSDSVLPLGGTCGKLFTSPLCATHLLTFMITQLVVITVSASTVF